MTPGTQGSGNGVVVAAGPTDGGPQQTQFLRFMLGGESFAIGILSIREIMEYGDLTVVPMMPAWVRGVINLRGAVVPVMDLQRFLGRKAVPVNRRTCIVIAEMAIGAEQQVIGIIVDSVSEVVDIPLSEIEPPPAFGAGLRSNFIAGMGKVRGAFVILLDIEDILACAEPGPPVTRRDDAFEVI